MFIVRGAFLTLVFRGLRYNFNSCHTDHGFRASEADVKMHCRSKECHDAFDHHNRPTSPQPTWDTCRTRIPPSLCCTPPAYCMIGVHLMTTGAIEAIRLPRNEEFRLDGLSEWIAHKRSRTEPSIVSDADVKSHRGEHERRRTELERASGASRLPSPPGPRPALSRVLVRLRRALSNDVARRDQA